ncbi:AMP-binding protein [Sporosarcina pasteurii]|uniref:Short-chain-fatty-acid--CoA ligase n=1 Tax=Sporosarcina pasteurii TaxID=1474 RepID=A0A380CIV5_SPOPA|nr:AMP-binding protein [Sporosarcina pasteurii]MDS9472107.1 AMP-binding protein [Sporosarcina pasteurii]QBQ06825.1 AMP-binding protein [Sporosarcina pasteurii]SUJ20774.1 Short-chain-fatty-acid--CoA ligase [Sporosarcina pasteurii]
MALLRKTVGEIVREQARTYPDAEAYVYPEHGIRKTYKEFDEETDLLAKAFIGMGIEKGEHIAIWSDNKRQWLLSQYATGKMGAALVTVNTNYQAAELEYLLQQSESTTLILDESFKGTSYIDIIRTICPELVESRGDNIVSENLPRLKRVILMTEREEEGMYKWSDLMAHASNVSDEQLEERFQSLDPDDVINIQYTSGTTGFPKGVMLTHNNIVNNGKIIGDRMKLTEQDKVCIPVPFFHCFGCVLGTLAAVTHASSMVIIEQFDAGKVLQAVQDEKCTALHGVPTMFIAELNHPEFHEYDTSSLRTGIMAGSTCPIEVMRRVIDDMGASEITICYGQTESSPVITQTTTDDPIEKRVSTVGKPHPHVEVKVVDPTTGEEVAVGEPGELWTRGYHVMKGYYNNEEATREAIDEDGWLRTGDIAIMDEDGYIDVTGRIRDMVIRGGENIYPREIEEFLYKHPGIEDVQIIGVPDPKYGEELMAWIIPKKGAKIDEASVREFCKGNISHFKIPRYVKFTDSYPMTASGKIMKFKLQEMSKEMITV